MKYKKLLLILGLLAIIIPSVSQAGLGVYLGAGSGITKGLWHFEGSSSDSSGNGNNGTDTAISYGLSYGKFGQGANFNGSTGYISMGNVLGFEYNQSFTIATWWKNNNTVSQNTISKQQNISPYAGYGIGTSISGYPQVFLYRDGNGAFIKTIPTLLNDKLHFVVMTYDGSNTINGLKMYVDGVLSNTTTDSNITFTLSILSTTPFQISGRGGTGLLMNGNIDEVIIENVAWTPTQIQKYYTNAKGRFGTL